VTSPDLRNELRVARDLAREAGRLILEVYATEFSVTDKGGDEGPVTEADKRANEHIVRTLWKAFPNDGIIAEESKDNSDARRFQRCWFVDPLDGTKEFVARNGEFAVHIGLAVEGSARLGVVFKPVDGKLYSAIVDEPCTLEHAGRTRELRVTDTSEPTQLKLLVSRSNKSRATDEIRRRLGITQVIESGSVGVKCGLLAEGVADLYIHSSPKSSRWDACAPEAILRAAGGRFTDLWGAQYRYDGVELQNVRGILGTNGAAQEQVLEAVRAVVGPTPRGA
jgi:3'(2'), 5'-bisphosphate nucleotidase